MKSLFLTLTILLASGQLFAADNLTCTCDAFGKSSVDELSITLNHNETSPLSVTNGCLRMVSNGSMVAVGASSSTHPSGFETSFYIARLKAMSSGNLGRYVISPSDPMANNGSASFVVRCSVE